MFKLLLFREKSTFWNNLEYSFKKITAHNKNIFYFVLSYPLSIKKDRGGPVLKPRFRTLNWKKKCFVSIITCIINPQNEFVIDLLLAKGNNSLNKLFFYPPKWHNLLSKASLFYDSTSLKNTIITFVKREYFLCKCSLWFFRPGSFFKSLPKAYFDKKRSINCYQYSRFVILIYLRQ